MPARAGSASNGRLQEKLGQLGQPCGVTHREALQRGTSPQAFLVLMQRDNQKHKFLSKHVSEHCS